MNDLEGKVVAITGSLGNLGRACVEAFNANHASLVLLDRGHGKLSEAFRDLDQDKHMFCEGVDLTDSASVEASVEQIRSRFDRLDVLVHTVGAFAGGKTVAAEEPNTFDFLMKVNAGTTLTTLRAALPLMQSSGGGRIVTVASRNALAGSPNFAAYSAAKAALLRITEAVAGEMAASNIAANCVIPGTIDTPQNRASSPDADYSTWVAPADIASVVVFLASDAARAVNGATIPVYGKS